MHQQHFAQRNHLHHHQPREKERGKGGGREEREEERESERGRDGWIDGGRKEGTRGRKERE